MTTEKKKQSYVLQCLILHRITTVITIKLLHPFSSQMSSKKSTRKHGCFVLYHLSFLRFPLYICRRTNVMNALPKTLWKKKVLSLNLCSSHKPFFVNASSKSLSVECVSQKNVLILSPPGFWSGMRREMETHPQGRLSKQCRHGEGHRSVFFINEQQVVQCTELLPLPFSLPQVLFFCLCPSLHVSETSNVVVGLSLRCRPVWNLLSSLSYLSSTVLPLTSFSASSRLFCLWKNPNY